MEDIETENLNLSLPNIGMPNIGGGSFHMASGQSLNSPKNAQHEIMNSLMGF
jgi:hypothetical protein